MCRRFSTVFINGKSFIKISTDFPTNDTLLDTVMLDTTPYISNSLNVFPENWKYAKKVAATRIKLNLFDKQLKLDPVQLKDHPAINQISLTNSSIRATGQSRIIINSNFQQNEQDKKTVGDGYYTMKKNMEKVENFFKEIANCETSFLIDKDNYNNPELKTLLKHRRKAMDFNLMAASDSEQLTLDLLFEEAYKLQHLYLRSYVRDPVSKKLITIRDLMKTQVPLTQIINILKINHFRGTLVLPYSFEHGLKNLEAAASILRDHAYVERRVGEIEDNWVVF